MTRVEGGKQRSKGDEFGAGREDVRDSLCTVLGHDEGEVLTLCLPEERHERRLRVGAWREPHHLAVAHQHRAVDDHHRVGRGEVDGITALGRTVDKQRGIKKHGRTHSPHATAPVNAR
ncbi:hypothetical protein GCM10025876_26660 [Demequina litorisediminis]|uniref:Uncharacterized protein n=1 Tax=Demequina litorisediminis TaxID=1849022 RepID=A0ABQ6IEZ0_9MICO|nr:hypothetical protein GCM10025876_26660 [Demequina litorisediminis]